MKLFAPIAAAAVLAAAMVSQPAAAAGSVSVEIAQPGVYGRVIIGDSRPAVIYEQPVIVAPARYAPVRRPIYLYVPPGHQRKWDKHCHRYEACGQPVYFIREDWVRERHAQRRPQRVEHRQARPHPHAQPQRQARRDDRRHAQPERKVRHDKRRGGDRRH